MRNGNGSQGKVFLRRNLLYVVNHNRSDGLRPRRPRLYYVHIVDKIDAAAGGAAVTGGPTTRTSVQPHHCTDTICLFCGFDAASLTGIWAHLHSNHGDHFDFSHRVTTDGTVRTVHILATRRTPSAKGAMDEDGARLAAPTLMDEEGTFAARTRIGISPAEPKVPAKRQEESHLLFCLQLKHDPSLMEIFPPKRIESDEGKPVVTYSPTFNHGARQELLMEVPVLKYFHSEDFQPFTIGDWVADVESEDEIDETWKHQIAQKQLEEFNDVSRSEKVFFKLWNDFMQSFPLVTQKSLPEKCFRFTETNALYLRQHNLEEQLIWHLTNLWDEGLIGRSHLVDCMKRYHSLISSDI